MHEIKTRVCVSVCERESVCVCCVCVCVYLLTVLSRVKKFPCDKKEQILSHSHMIYL